MKISAKIRNNPKDLLERDIKPTIGDFVTTNDNFPLKAYVLKQIGGVVSAIIGLRVTEIGDAVEFHEYFTPTEDLIYLDESFITVDSELWIYREELLSSIRNEEKASKVLQPEESCVEESV